MIFEHSSKDLFRKKGGSFASVRKFVDVLSFLEIDCKNKEKLQQKQTQKGNNTNFIQKNSNVVPLKDKSLTKRLNGMSVRISRGPALNTKQK